MRDQAHPQVILTAPADPEHSIRLITELCTGGELFDYLVEKTRFTEFEARRLFGQICLGLGYVHGKGVVHRDLKLENVLLDERCNPKMADFGGPHEQIAQCLRALKGSLKKLGLKVRALPPFLEKGRARVRGL
ncbi:hypothetical protein PGT21_035851 [Puccinia graminis f. sp. tritici]|uniref:Protein kinase domain-containing protein n=1 Tax=Puccinia graminis f. sp. tritici TaxID=56615 RepID=A0A5B0P591_PUCGR|nr:hypothetical protein PGT21_035851 [Puccinia graminis f. sp. tritici]KAA1121400.1 hypothetical protein PGTUg99_019951 [Puccinia graminis f. sp. tritici]